ncbi:MAG: MATE family efflux transporter [Lachnospiraceae bacterium]|nr:MATE family efflux transporter [Lachnospiraceae bacterium]
MNKDLTIGDPKKVLWKFCLPLFGSIIFQQLYNIADSFVAGKFIGEDALAAVGNSYEITLIFIAFAFGCNIGCSVIVAKLFGAKDTKNLKTAVSTALISSAVLCAVLMLVGILCSGLMLEAIRTPKKLLPASKLYLDIYILGLPFVFFYNMSTGIFSALGDSKTPFYFLAASSTANIAVDILFVKGFHMGVSGVAWATFLCQGVSCVLAVTFVFRRMAAFKSKEKVPVFSWSILRDFAKIAIPSILQQSFVSVGNILIQSIINGYGAGTIAGYASAIKLNNLVITSFTTLGNGMSNFAAQNLGAGLKERIRQGFRGGLYMVWTISAPIVFAYLVFGRALVHVFINEPSVQALDTGIMFLRIVAPFYFLISVKLIADGVLRGAGRMVPFMIGTFSDLILRVVLAFIFSKMFGSVGIWCAWPVGWFIGAVLSFAFYRAFMKSDK